VALVDWLGPKYAFLSAQIWNWATHERGSYMELSHLLSVSDDYRLIVFLLALTWSYHLDIHYV
jgi:hypothetical protein